MAMAEYAWTSFNGNAKVFEAPPQGKVGDRFHPTQKPVGLYGWVLRQFAHEGDKIFDPMMGSQSSRIAAYKLGYDFCGCELDAEYYRLGNERFERECHGIIKMADGSTIKQLSLFDN
jgi:site-specific DNA-methyltransferase (adenine-specific)